MISRRCSVKLAYHRDHVLNCREHYLWRTRAVTGTCDRSSVSMYGTSPSTLNPPQASPSPQRPVHKLPLQPRNLHLESLDLPPTVQRPPVLLPQTPHHIALGPLNGLVQLVQPLPAFKPLPQRRNLPLHRVRAQALGSPQQRLAVAAVLVRARVGVRLGRLGRDALLELAQGLRLTRFELLELVGDAGLDVELERLGASRVGLVEVGWVRK